MPSMRFCNIVEVEKRDVGIVVGIVDSTAAKLSVAEMDAAPSSQWRHSF
jgi:hypothetical protein